MEGAVGCGRHTCRLVKAGVRGGGGGQRRRNGGAVKQLPSRRRVARMSRWRRVGPDTPVGRRRFRWCAGWREHLKTTCRPFTTNAQVCLFWHCWHFRLEASETKRSNYYRMIDDAYAIKDLDGTEWCITQQPVWISGGSNV